MSLVLQGLSIAYPSASCLTSNMSRLQHNILEIMAEYQHIKYLNIISSLLLETIDFHWVLFFSLTPSTIIALHIRTLNCTVYIFVPPYFLHEIFSWSAYFECRRRMVCVLPCWNDLLRLRAFRHGESSLDSNSITKLSNELRRLTTAAQRTSLH